VADRHCGVLGASSLVGAGLLPLLRRDGWRVTAWSRRAGHVAQEGVTWQVLPNPGLPETPVPSGGAAKIPFWFCVAPIWVLPAYFPWLEAQGARRVVVLSSTSRFTKDNSSDSEEQAVARRLQEAEMQVQAWGERHGVEWVILRPTLIYGFARDKNITEIVRFIRRFGFFPLFGKAKGLRQPVHAQDVAGACAAAMAGEGAANQAYNLSGGETLSYRDMVARIFGALGRRPRVLSVPLWAFRGAIAVLHLLPRYSHWSVAMAERMNQDLVFDHGDAARALSFRPRQFRLSAEDVAA